MVRSGEPWAKIPNWIITHPDLDASAVRVYAVIVTHARGGKAWPSVRTIAEEARCARSTVDRSLLALEKIGALVIDRTFAGKRHTANVYTLPDGPTIGTSHGPTIGPRGPTMRPSDGPTMRPELDLKINRTRRDDLSTEESEPVLQPGESPSQALRRLRSS